MYVGITLYISGTALGGGEHFNSSHLKLSMVFLCPEVTQTKFLEFRFNIFFRWRSLLFVKINIIILRKI